jgi:hypothetical protein
MSVSRQPVTDPQRVAPLRLWVAMARGLVLWLALVWYGTSATLVATDRDELATVATWGVAIVAGGLLLVYTWAVSAAIVERERLRGTLTRGLSLADQALDEARRRWPDLDDETPPNHRLG